MKYVSVDLETTGLDESYCQILEFAAVIGDTTDFCTPVEEFPSLTYRFYYDRVIGDPYALHLNRGLLNDMVSRPSSYLYINIDSLWSSFANWLDTQKFAIEGKVMLAGKNVGSFDRRFLNKVPRWDWRRFHHRYLDPAHYFFKPLTDAVLPDTKECIKRSGINWEDFRLHTALNDARLVVELLRKGFQLHENAVFLMDQSHADAGSDRASCPDSSE